MQKSGCELQSNIMTNFLRYVVQTAMRKHVESAKEKVKRWQKNKETIDLNDDDSYQNFEAEWNDGQHTPHSTNYSMGYSPKFGVSN